MLKTYLRKILMARVYDVAIESPLDLAPGLSKRLGNRVFLKREDLQPVFSFKLRGAYNKMVNVPPAQRQAGFIASSAGNHAQGVALAASRLEAKAVIVMPRTTPGIKVDAVRSHGATTVLHGDIYDDAYAHAKELSEKHGYYFVHPYDDEDVIAGQGTIGMEILRQLSNPPDAIFVPVGGGGLISGISAYVKSLYPTVKIIGVEPDDAPTLATALAKKKRVLLDQVGIFADGVAVRQIGAEPFRICSKTVDEVILVTADEICAATKDIFDDTRSIAEPSGALALAGLKKYVQRGGVHAQTLVAIESGANVNFDRLRHVAERAALGEKQEILLAVTIPEVPGSFRRFCHALGKQMITEFNYRYNHPEHARVFVGIKVESFEADREKILSQLKQQDYPVVDMTDNEVAKLHVRYMVGGHAAGLEHERVMRFRFPERPGALEQFLSTMRHEWNISMFHYRNHGAAYGRILAGVQVPPHQRGDFESFLKELRYPYWDESDNPAYELFLS